jgi:SAM-dependent methyltransferase
MTNKQHWDELYGRKGADEVSWYRPHLERSIRFIAEAGIGRAGGIIDVGGGAATLVDDLLAAGYQNLTVLDLSAAAIEVARARLGARGAGVKWLVGDVTRAELPAGGYDFWHDRAVFHFLRDADERRRYVAQVRRALKPGGHIVVATFGPEGPERCSGLDVVRYDADGLHAEFGGEFEKVASATEAHQTPWGAEQQFVYCYCRMA